MSYCRRCAVFLVLLLPGLTWAQENKAPASEPAPLDKRLAEIENELTALLKEVQSFRRDVRASREQTTTGIRILRLKNGNAIEMAKVLKELFRGPTGQVPAIAPDQRAIFRSRRGPTAARDVWSNGRKAPQACGGA